MVNPIGPKDPLNALPGDPDLNRPTRVDNDFQRDPALDGERAGGGRMAMYMLAAAVLLGAAFYGLSNGAINPSNGTKTATAPVTQDGGQSRPPVPPGVRDVTPNSMSGTTTGAAPARPQESSPPTTAVDRSNKSDAN